MLYFISVFLIISWIWILIDLKTTPLHRYEFPKEEHEDSAERNN